MKSKKVRVILWTMATLAIVVVAGVAWVFRHYPTAAIMKDLRAGIAARPIKNPDERIQKYLEGRYGSLSDPANRQKAFLGFFDLEHIRALQIIFKHTPPELRRANVKAMADWIAQYRNSMSPQERVALSAQIQSADGEAMLKQATAQYNNQDVYYRGSTVPVISQLLTTVHELQTPP